MMPEATRDRGGGADRHRRRDWAVPGLVCLDAGGAGLQESADGGAAVGGRFGHYGVGRRAACCGELQFTIFGSPFSRGLFAVALTQEHARRASASAGP